MYSNLLIIHSLFRWVVLFLLLIAIYRAFIGYIRGKPFLKLDNAIRHWTATAAHLQLIIGILLYIKSPVVKYFWAYSKEAILNREAVFFGIIHITLMILSVVLVTIGSALAKRKPTGPGEIQNHVDLVFNCVIDPVCCHPLAIFSICQSRLF